MTMSSATAVGFFVTLVALYSPLSAAAAYAQVIGGYGVDIRRKMAARLFGIVAGFVAVMVWLGEFIIEVLNVSTTTLSAVAGVALLYAGIPMMRGIDNVPAEDSASVGERYGDIDRGLGWQEVLISPVTFPLSIGGSTVAVSVASASKAGGWQDLLALSAMGVAFAMVVSITSLLGGAIPGRVSRSGQTILQRASGVLVTAIGLSLLVSNVTKMVIEAAETVE
jgi:multiple antibiotic resistance protein